MTSKAFLVLLMFLASILLISAEVAPKDVDEKLNKKDDNLETNGVEKGSKYYGGGGFGGPWGGGYGGGYGGRWGGGYGGGWRGGYGGGGYGGGGYCRFGCCGWGYGGCRRCCYYPGEHLEAHIDAEPHT